jgi:glycosyltransferase involved in cell wall biosynthesis
LAEIQSSKVEIAPYPQFVRSRALVDAGLARRPTFARLAREPFLRYLDLANSSRNMSAADIFHSTYYRRSSLPRHNGILNAVTVHDMTPELYPEYFPGGNPHANKSFQVMQADLVFCVSDTTRTDVNNFYPNFKGEIRVTPHGTGWPFIAELSDLRDVVQENRGIPFPYLIYVGSRDQYKAFHLVPAALASVRRAGLDVGLVIVGGGSLTGEEGEQLRIAGVAPERLRIVSPDDQGLAQLYRGALMLVYTSEYEGFGIPVLDALATGCPVVTSDAPALLEAGGGQTRVFTRGSASELANRIVEVLESPASETVKQRNTSMAYARGRTWRASAEMALDAYGAIF